MQMILFPSRRRYDADTWGMQTSLSKEVDKEIFMLPDSNIYHRVLTLASSTVRQRLFQSHAGDSRLRSEFCQSLSSVVTIVVARTSIGTAMMTTCLIVSEMVLCFSPGSSSNVNLQRGRVF
jgi:hypothetical protein